MLGFTRPKKIEKERPILSIGRTRTSKGHVTRLAIGRTLMREGHLPECPPQIPVIGRTLSVSSSDTRYWEDSESKRVSSHTRYWEDPGKGRAASRISSRSNYWRNPGKKRAAACMSNYAKHGKGICASRRSRYALAEPKGSVIEVQEKKYNTSY